VFLLECLLKDVCFTTLCLFEDIRCQRVNAKLYGKLCQCIPPDGKHARGDKVVRLWIRRFVWAPTGVLGILTHLLSFSVVFSFLSFSIPRFSIAVISAIAPWDSSCLRIEFFCDEDSQRLYRDSCTAALTSSFVNTYVGR
jgi:hypothetical protein